MIFSTGAEDAWTSSGTEQNKATPQYLTNLLMGTSGSLFRTGRGRGLSDATLLELIEANGP